MIDHMLVAEKKCHISYRLPWDKETDAVMTAYNIVQTHFSCLRCNSLLPKTIAAKMKRLDEPFVLPSTLEETDKLLDKLYKQRKDLILSRRSNQATSYIERKEAFVALYKIKFGSEKKAEAIFDQKEETNKLMRSLPKSKSKGGGGISNILVPIPNTKKILWEPVTNAPNIERFVLDRNIHHFSSAGKTPLATNDIMDMLGFDGNTEISQQILAGEANINDITDNEAAQLLLQLMNSDTAPIVLDFTATNMMNRYKKWKEKTIASVASGRHLGHFHALF